MPDLRRALGEAGYEDVATLVQSGNIVLTSGKAPKTLARELGKGLRGDGTARNWNTVTKLLELADGG
jgi:uncharacterized protein (DUF1697 family)